MPFIIRFHTLQSCFMGLLSVCLSGQGEWGWWEEWEMMKQRIPAHQFVLQLLCVWAFCLNCKPSCLCCPPPHCKHHSVCVWVCGSRMRLRWSRHGTEIFKECLLLWLHRAGFCPTGLCQQDRAGKAAFIFLPRFLFSPVFLSLVFYSSVSVVLEIFTKK